MGVDSDVSAADTDEEQQQSLLPREAPKPDLSDVAVIGVVESSEEPDGAVSDHRNINDVGLEGERDRGPNSFLSSIVPSSDSPQETVIGVATDDIVREADMDR